MVKLSLEFKTIEELADFIAKRDMTKAVVSDEATVEVPPVIDDSSEKKKAAAKKAAATRKANKAKKEAEAAALANTPVVDVNATAASVMQPAPTGIDRQSYIEGATKLVTEMQSLGLSDADLGIKVQEAFASVGIQPCRISELDDASLPVVVNAINGIVEGLKNPSAAASPSYI